MFLLTALQRVFNGPLNERWASFPDLSVRERLLVVPPVLLMFLLGVYPQLLLGAIDETVIRMVKGFGF